MICFQQPMGKIRNFFCMSDWRNLWFFFHEQLTKFIIFIPTSYWQHSQLSNFQCLIQNFRAQSMNFVGGFFMSNQWNSWIIFCDLWKFTIIFAHAIDEFQDFFPATHWRNSQFFAQDRLGKFVTSRISRDVGICVLRGCASVQ